MWRLLNQQLGVSYDPHVLMKMLMGAGAFLLIVLLLMVVLQMIVGGNERNK